VKEIIAIIRPNKAGQTKQALENLGFPCFLAASVLGRGHQRGIAAEVNCDLPDALTSQGRSGGMKYVPKRMFTIVVRDEDADAVVKTLIGVNQTARIGDGKIFVCPVEGALRVRTGEMGETAIL